MVEVFKYLKYNKKKYLSDKNISRYIALLPLLLLLLRRTSTSFAKGEKNRGTLYIRRYKLPLHTRCSISLSLTCIGDKSILFIYPPSIFPYFLLSLFSYFPIFFTLDYFLQFLFSSNFPHILVNNQLHISF